MSWAAIQGDAGHDSAVFGWYIEQIHSCGQQAAVGYIKKFSAQSRGWNRSSDRFVRWHRPVRFLWDEFPGHKLDEDRTLEGLT